MRDGWEGNQALAERILRADSDIHPIVEAVVAENEDIKDTQDEWSNVDDLTGLKDLPLGITLARNTDATHAEFSVASADEGNVIADLDKASPWFMVEVEWDTTDASLQELHNLDAHLDPDVDGTGREVEEFRAQLFRVTEESNEGWAELQPITPVAKKTVTGNSDQTFTFPLFTVVPPTPGDPPEKIDQDVDSKQEATRPRTFIFIWAVKASGDPAGNVAWIGNAGAGNTETVTDGGGTDVGVARHHKMSRINSSKQVNTGGRFQLDGLQGGMPEFALRGKTYTSDTAAFTGDANEIDLSSAPASDTDLRIVASGSEPGDSTLDYEIYNGTSWVDIADGDLIGEDNTDDGGEDLTSVPRQQTYHIRVKLSPTSTGSAAPIARRLGVEEISRTDLTGLTNVNTSGWGFDPVTLKGEIPEADIQIIKDGLDDYRSEGERLFADNHIGDVEFVIWLGSPDLSRNRWLHIDTFLVEDYNSEGASIDVVGVSPMNFLKTAVPPYDSTTDERQPTEYTNSTLKAVYDDLIDTQIALQGRYRGPGVEDTSSQTVSKVIEGSDGKEELDAIAHLAGGAVISSQGRVKFQPVFDDDRVVSVIPREEVGVKSVTPGYRSRIDEYFVNYNYSQAQDRFLGEVRSFHGNALTKLGRAQIDPPDDLDKKVARWIPKPSDNSTTDPANNLAGHVASRTITELGTGLPQLTFTTTYARPHLEPGDNVAVQTDALVFRDPNTDEDFRGVLWLIGTVQRVRDVKGTEITLWAREVHDVLPDDIDVGLINFADPEILSADIDFQSDGTVDVTGKTDDAAAVRIATSTTQFPGKSTVRAQSLISVDSEDTFEATAVTSSIAVGQTVYVSILAFENADGSGSESAELFKIKDTRQATEDLHVEWTATEDRDANTGTLTGDVVGGLTYDIEIIEVLKDGTTNSLQLVTGVTDGGTNDPVSQTVSLEEKTNRTLFATVKDSDGNLVQKTEPFTFDPDKIPEFEAFQAEVKDDGTVDIRILGDVDANSVEAEVDFTNDGVVDETLTAGSSGSPTRSLEQATSGTVPEGELGTVKGILYVNDDLTGTSKSMTVPVSRKKGDPAVGSRLRAVKDGDGIRDLFLRIDGPSEVFPVDWQIFQGDPTGTVLASGTVSSATEVGPTDAAALNDITLPQSSSLHWWAELTDTNSLTTYAFASADRDKVPGGAVTKTEFKPLAELEINFDDDVEEVVVTVPSGKTKTWSGLSGGGRQTYIVGSTTLDDASTESVLESEEERSPYVVEIKGGGVTKEIFRGALHGHQGRVLEVRTFESDFDSDGVVEGRAQVNIVNPIFNYDLRFETRQGRGAGSWTTAGSATSVSIASADVTQDVDLVEKVASFIRVKAYRASHLDEAAHIVDTAGPFTFDPDEIPDFENFVAAVKDDGTVAVSVRGDAVDTASIEAEVDFNGDGTVDETLSVSSGSSLNQTTTGTVAEGDAGTVKAILYTASSFGGTTKATTIDISRFTDTEKVLDVDVSEDRGADTWDVTITVLGSDSYDVALAVAKGDGGFSAVNSWSAQGTGTSLTGSGTLADKVNTRVRVRAWLASDTHTAANRIHNEVVTLDQNAQANLVKATVSADELGNVVAKATTDLDGEGGIIYLERADGSDPSAPDPLGDGTDDASINLGAGVREGKHAFSTDLPVGTITEVAFRAETPGGVLANAKHIVRDRANRGAKPSINTIAGSVGDDGTDDTYNVEWTTQNASDGQHDMKIDYYDAGSLINTNTVTDPVTDTNDVFINSGAGGDPGESHKIALRLKDTNGNTIDRKETNLEAVDTSGGGSAPQEPK